MELALFFRLRDLFSLQVDMVFYDLTSTYFEGAGPPELGANGHSRDGKPRNPQVLVGLVMVDVMGDLENASGSNASYSSAIAGW